MQVIKFGGSSVANAERIKAATAIIERHHQSEAVTVVVSAMAGVTNSLLHAGQERISGHNGWQEMLADVAHRHRQAYRELQIANTTVFDRQWSALLADIDQLAHEKSNGSDERDLQRALRFSGWGERLMTVLFASALRKRNISSEAFTDAPIILAGLDIGPVEPMPTASVLATRAWLAPQLASLRQRNGIPVLPGYIARDAHGTATIVGRNGSDYSASVIAAALGADALYIYSDVAGVYTADPHKDANAIRFPSLTYSQAAQLAAQGAKVLHPRTVEPLVQGSIPLYLRSVYEPDAPGTDIMPVMLCSKGKTMAQL